MAGATSSTAGDTTGKEGTKKMAGRSGGASVDVRGRKGERKGRVGERERETYRTEFDIFMR